VSRAASSTIRRSAGIPRPGDPEGSGTRTLGQPPTRWDRIIQRIPGVRRDPTFLLAVAFMAVYATVWSIISVDRVYALRASVYDLGMFIEQGHLVFTLAGPPLFWVGVVFRLGGLLLFGGLSWGGAPALLVTQAILLGSGGLWIYAIARNRALPPALSLGLAGAYWVNPLLDGINFDDYHVEAFFVPLFLLAYLLFLRRRWWSSALLFLLSGLLWYPLAFFPFLFGIVAAGDRYLVRRGKGQVPRGSSHLGNESKDGPTAPPGPSEPPKDPPWGFGPLLSGISLACLAIGSLPSLGTGPLLSQLLAEGHVGTLSPFLDWPGKIVTVAFVLSTVAFLPILKPRWLVFCGPFFLLTFLANYAGYLYPPMLADWHGFLVLPFLFLGAVEGVWVLRDRRTWWDGLRLASRRASPDFHQGSRGRPCRFRFRERRGEVGRAPVAVGLVLGLTVGPALWLAPYGPWNANGPVRFDLPQVLDYNWTLYQQFLSLAHLIPPGDPAVILQDDMPELLPRPLLPGAVTPMVAGPFDNVAYNLSYLDESRWEPIRPDYVIGNPTPGPDSFFESVGSFPYNTSVAQILTELYASGRYGILGEASGMWVIERGYTGPLRVYAPFSADFGPQAFESATGTLGGGACPQTCLVVHDTASVLTAWYGPYTYLAPGSYRVRFELALENWTPASHMTLQVTGMDARIVFGSQNLSGPPAGVTSEPFFETIPVTIPWGSEGVEFRAVDCQFSGTILFYGVTVEEIAPPPPVLPPPG
jgi:hypothetical protein